MARIHQLQTVTDFAALLDAAELGFDADALADALWLAQYVQPEALETDPDNLEPNPDDPAISIIERRVDTTADASLPVATSPAAAPERSTEADDTPQGIPIQIPAAPALRARRELAKALRPLKLTVPSRVARVFDADASAEHTAEQGILSAVMAPAPERWFDLAIVIEQSLSTPLWRDTLAELKLLAERQGAFRRVSTWQVQAQGNRLALLPHWRYTEGTVAPGQPKTLVDPAGRRIIWLVSDCTSPLWQQPQIYRWLATWGKHGPTTLVQLLPGRLWPRTALGRGVPVQLSAFNPGVPNAQLKVSETLPFSDVAGATLPPVSDDSLQPFDISPLTTVPVVSLEAYPLHQWARVVAGAGEATTPGYAINQATFTLLPPPVPNRPAQPLSHMHLLPETQQVHVAEVYMSGLLRSVTPPEANLPPHQMQYDFLSDEVRDALTDLTPIAKTEAVLDAVSSYIAQRLGLQVRTYEALLLLDLEGRPNDQQVVIPFARIAKRALQRLGGDYAAIAERIDRPDQRRIVPLPTPPRDFPELKVFEFEYPLISFEEIEEAAAEAHNEFDPALKTFSYETVRVNARGQVVERIQGIAQYFTEPIIERVPALSLKKISGFVAYAPQDKVLKDDLMAQLKALSGRQMVTTWYERRIPIGSNWEERIAKTLNQSDLVLLLLSADFVASDYCYGDEIHQAIERHNAGETRVIPVIVRPTDWGSTPFARFQALPRDARPITTWSDPNEAFLDIAQGISRVAERMRLEREAKHALDMVAIPGGTFRMGSPENEREHNDSESPQHEVTVPAFFMGKHPITQAQWRAVAALEPVERELDPDPARFKGDDRPVEQVSWHDATEFCARLSRLTGRDYRLPTEAEWEYACRAGTTTPFAFGETLTDELANYRASSTFAQEARGQYREETTPVGTFPPNAFGLYDMHGSVWEWCQDHWHDSYNGNPPLDGSAWLFAEEGESGDRSRVLRGGSGLLNPHNCRSAYRGHALPDIRTYSLGFRVVCSAARDSS